MGADDTGTRRRVLEQARLCTVSHAHARRNCDGGWNPDGRKPTTSVWNLLRVKLLVGPHVLSLAAIPLNIHLQALRSLSVE